MAIEIARYQFHSWCRKGIAVAITEQDDLGSNASDTQGRASVNLAVKLNEATINKTFALIGPGDVIGINREMIVRTEPLHWITDFEPNYLAFVEFYDEDFAWRYTPAAPQNNDLQNNENSKLRPWIFLLILKENEFDRTGRRTPVPTINIHGANVFPPLQETWLWAHAHSNANIPDDELSTYERFLQSLNTTIDTDPDQIYCRLMSPRKLESNTGYFAFIIPAFESGRLAGLEQPANDVNVQMPSWSDTGANGEMPVYFEWQFRTGLQADFESLVKLLVPRAVDPRVGIRDMDCNDPGFVTVTNETFPGTDPAVLGLEGALKSPQTVSTTFPLTSPNEFQTALQEIVNLPFQVIENNGSEDPIISIPLYGGKHAKTTTNEVVRLDVTSDNWVNDLNRDPRTRVPAGCGTTVVQKNQEAYMQKAWQQVEKILAANRRIRLTTLYMKVALRYAQKTIAAFSDNVLLAVSKPLHKRVMGTTETIHQQVKKSPLPAAALSPAFRRIIRPNNKLVQKIANNRRFPYNKLIRDLNDINSTDDKIKPAPVKKTPVGAPNTKVLADKIFPTQPAPVLEWPTRNRNALTLGTLALGGVAALAGAFIVGGLIGGAGVGGYTYLTRRNRNRGAAERLLDPATELEFIPRIPASPRFNVILDNEAQTPPGTSNGAGRDTVEARNFRRALVDINTSLSARAPGASPTEFRIITAAQKLVAAVDPHKAYPAKLSATVKFPGGINTTEPENILPAIAYPDIEDPMYKGLTAISDELLLPNLQLVPNNTITLLKTNPKFIESYMVGLNHEMGRELLWREFPTDERGSYFRQFWDVKGVIRPDNNASAAELSEQHKDIEPIHTWDRNTKLGTHNKRAMSGQPEQLVLMIRGDLLKRYPNCVILAQKARKNGGDLDLVIRTDLNDQQFKREVKFPLYKAEISPDIKFFGFDLTIEQAKGSELSPSFNDRFGWFFIIQEMPGEPRFGMDVGTSRTPAASWDDLAWDQFASSISFIKGTVPPSIDPESIKWGRNAASMAYILFQKPSMVAVHAKDMLENLTA